MSEIVPPPSDEASAVSLPHPSCDAADPAALYVDLLKRCLINWLYGDTEALPLQPELFLKPEVLGEYRAGRLDVVHPRPLESAKRGEGLDWPPTAHTMIGWKRLDQLHRCVDDVLRHQVPGDLLEAGVWRGGASILMRGILKAHGVRDRRVYLADSFAGLPAPDPRRYPQDRGMNLNEYPVLAVPLEQVRHNFAKYGLLDEQVQFLPGWFRDTLASAPVEQLAVLRLDGDLYESTMDTLIPLYPRVSVGGYVVVDDYVGIAACRQAVDDYRREHGIEEPMVPIDRAGAYWRKTR